MLKEINFKAKLKSMLLHNNLLKFNSAKILYNNNAIYIISKEQLEILYTINLESLDTT